MSFESFSFVEGEVTLTKEDIDDAMEDAAPK